MSGNRTSYLAVVFATFAAMLLCFALPGYVVMRTNARDEAQVMDVRVLPEAVRLNTIGNFIAAKGPPVRPVLLVIGDSQSAGFHVGRDAGLTAALSRMARGYDVINLSIVGATPVDMRRVVALVQRAGLKPAVVLFGINAAHLADGAELISVLPTSEEQPDIAMFLQFNLLLSYAVIERHFSRPAAFSFAYIDLLDGRYQFRTHASDAEMRGLLDDLAGVGARVIVYTQPTATEAFAYYGFDLAATHGELLRMLEYCRSIAGIVCLDLFDALPQSAFLDIVHLNPNGHMRLANLLAEQINTAPAN